MFALRDLRESRGRQTGNYLECQRGTMERVEKGFKGREYNQPIHTWQHHKTSYSVQRAYANKIVINRLNTMKTV